MPASRVVPWAKPIDSLVNTLTRPLGLEIELATWGAIGNRRPQHFRYTIDHDGSVRPSGQEMVLQPLAGDQFIKAIFEFSQMCFDDTGVTVNDTCGLHVHVAAQDLSYWDLRRLLVLYLGYEREIYSTLVDRLRADNAFCGLFPYDFRSDAVPVLMKASTTNEIKSVLAKELYGLALPDPNTHKASPWIDIRKDKYGRSVTARRRECRYWGLNLHSWFHRGTVEFRMHEGTLAQQELLCWPLFCGWFIHTAIAIPDAQLKDWIDMSTIRTKRPITELIKTYMPSFLYTWANGKYKASLPEAA
jgi:hypothetical protein